MASRKCVLSIKGSSGYGYSETYYYNGATDLPTMSGIVQNLAAARAQMLSGAYSVSHARVQGAIARQVITILLNGGAGYIGTLTIPSAPQEVAVEVILQGSTGHYNRKFLRGLPLNVVSGDNFTPDSAFTSGANTWTAQLTGFSNWNIQGRPQSNSPFSITGLQPTPPRGFTGISTGLVLSNGSVYRISKSSVSGYNGLKTVTQVLDVPTGLYQFGGAAPGAADVNNNSKIQSTQPYDTPIASTVFVGLSRRAGGSPFGRSRGRRQTQYSLRR